MAKGMKVGTPKMGKITEPKTTGTGKLKFVGGFKESGFSKKSGKK